MKRLRTPKCSRNSPRRSHSHLLMFTLSQIIPLIATRRGIPLQAITSSPIIQTKVGVIMAIIITTSSMISNITRANLHIKMIIIIKISKTINNRGSMEARLSSLSSSQRNREIGKIWKSLRTRVCWICLSQRHWMPIATLMPQKILNWTNISLLKKEQLNETRQMLKAPFCRQLANTWALAFRESLPDL